MRSFPLVALSLWMCSALPALAGPRVAIAGIERDYSAGAAAQRLARGLHESELAVAGLETVQAAVGVNGAAQITECLLERNRACATAPQLGAVEAVAVARLSRDGRVGRLVATTPDGRVLFDRSLRAPNLTGLLDQLEAAGRDASRAIATAYGDAPLVERRTLGWTALVVGTGFGALSAAFANSARLQAAQLGGSAFSGPINPVHAFMLEQGMTRDSTLAIGLGAAGVLAAAGGLHVLILRPGSYVQRVEVAPSGNGIAVGGSFQ